MIKKRDKKGAEMTIGTIVVIILALVVLIFLVFGFSSGWNNIWEKIINFGQGESNVATVIQACQFACSSNNVYDYCRARDLKFVKGTPTMYGYELDTSGKVSTTCMDMQTKNIPGMDKCTTITACQKTCKGTSTYKCETVAASEEATCKAIGCSYDATKTPKATTCTAGVPTCANIALESNCGTATGCKWA
jgi:hypothetical protein